MDREIFEQLVSQWLDEPERDELRTQVEQAAAESDELARLWDEWLRLHQLVRDALPGTESVDWAAFRQRVGAAVHTSAPGRDLDEHVRRTTDIEGQVDWSRLRARIAQAVADADRAPTVIRFPTRRVLAGAAVLMAAAAALVFMFALPARLPTAPTGFASCEVQAAGQVPEIADGSRPFAQVTVGPPPEVEQPVDQTQSRIRGAREPQLAEVFLMVTPPRLASASGGRMFPLGLN
jgi:hypothetical protein